MPRFTELQDSPDYYPTSGGLENYAKSYGMTKGDFISWIKKRKNIADVGSGGGLIEKEIEVMRESYGLKGVKVTPIDMIYSSKKGLDYSLYSTHLISIDNLGLRLAKSVLKKTEADFRKKAVASDYTFLPFADNSFRGLLARNSFGIHAQNREQLLNCYQETYRVLKKGGEGLITVSYDELEGILRCNGFTYSLGEVSYLNPSLRKNVFRTTRGEQVENYYLRVSK